jgi:hypothetical protein
LQVARAWCGELAQALYWSFMMWQLMHAAGSSERYDVALA